MAMETRDHGMPPSIDILDNEEPGANINTSTDSIASSEELEKNSETAEFVDEKELSPGPFLATSSGNTGISAAVPSADLSGGFDLAENTERSPDTPSKSAKELIDSVIGAGLSNGISASERRRTVSPYWAPFQPKNGRSLSSSIRTELSALIREIHSNLYEEHKIHPAFLSRKSSPTSDIDDGASVPTCDEVLEAFSIDAALIPEMSVREIVGMLTYLFGERHPTLPEIFEREQIDGAGLLELSLDGYLNLLKIPVGPAVTLDGIVKRARELRSLSARDS